MRNVRWFMFVCCLPAFLLVAGCRQSPEAIQRHLQEQLIGAKAGDVIELPEGKFHFDRTLSLTVDKVTLRGKGMDKTILSFAGQKEGAQGVLVKANDFTIEDIAIEDPAGDALTIQGGTNITVRRVRTEWTRGPNENNGPYGIYPVECKNLLVEESIARDAADAGIYVGQSENVVIRRNRSEYNVDGYEIENSENVDAYENVATHNTGGMGVFNLPNLPRQDGKHVRVFNNQIIDNNTTNFAPKSLGPIHDLPTGTGIYVMAIKQVEAFGNKIQGNGTVNVFLDELQHGRFAGQLAENRGVADYADGFQAGRHAILSLHAADIFSRQRYFRRREIARFAHGHDQGAGGGAGRVAAGYSI